MKSVELEWRLIYSIVVAGKSARFANRVVRNLRGFVPFLTSPVEFLSVNPYVLKECKTGRYFVLNSALLYLREDMHSFTLKERLDLRRCNPEKLEKIPGVGPKTARFFIAWTRPNARVAVLDRHVLRWLRENGYPDAPKKTPTGKQYLELERAFLKEAKKRGKTPRELDLEIWSAAATAPNIA